ncbi:LamG-like jellyroll fold domain-containing protein [Verrucomicrobiota bacterium]
MKKTSCLILLMLFLHAVVSVSISCAAELKRYKAAFKEQVEKIEANYLADILSCSEKYIKALEILQDKKQKTGDLDGWQIVRKEKERFTSEKEIPEEDIVNKPLELKSLQEKYREYKEKQKLKRAQELAALVDKYQSKLEPMKKEFTRAGKIEQALEIKMEMERVVSLEEVKKARELLKAYADRKAAEAKSRLIAVKKEPKPKPKLSKSKELILHYSFNRKNGKKVVDESGNGNHGLLKNGAEYASGVSGNGLNLRGAVDRFGASGDHVIMPSLDFTSMTSFSITLWSQTYSSGLGESLIAFGQGGEGKGITIFVQDYPNNDTVFRVGEKANSILIKPDRKDRERYVFYCMTYEDGVMKAYKNALLVGEKNDVKPELSLTNAALGRHWWPSTSKDTSRGTSTRLSAKLDEVKIYSRALSEKEIKENYRFRK